MQLILRLSLQSQCAAGFDDLHELLSLLSAHGHRSGYELMHQVLTPHFGLQQRETLLLLCKEMDWAVPLELARAGSVGEREEKVEETEHGGRTQRRGRSLPSEKRSQHRTLAACL